jgi:hypothetical protein
LEKWLQHQPDRRKNYTDFIKEYEELGHMQLVSGGMDINILPASSSSIQT